MKALEKWWEEKQCVPLLWAIGAWGFAPVRGGNA